MAKRLRDKRLRLGAGHVATANKAKSELRHFLRSLVLSIKNCVEKHIANALASENKRSSTVVEILCTMDSELHDIVSSQYVLGDGLLDTGSFKSSRDVLLLPRIDAAPDGDTSAVPAFDKTQTRNSTRFEKDPNNSLKQLERRKISRMRT